MAATSRLIGLLLFFTVFFWLAALSPERIAAQQPEFYDVPFAPGQWNIGRKSDEGQLRYCVDERDPDWEVANAIAEAIAAGLLVQPMRHVVESGMVREDITKIYQVLLEHCDVHMGFKLIAGGLPEWVIVTRAYYEAEYVFVTADPGIASMDDLMAGGRIGATMGTSAHLQLLSHVTAMAPQDRWQIFPMGTNELAIQSLRDGTVDVALVWGPTFWARANADPALADLRIIDSNPLPAIKLGVGALLLSDNTYLRATIDEAIAALIADGTIASILERHDFAATAAP